MSDLATNTKVGDKLSPSFDDIKIFIHVLFSGCSGYIPCRSFAEKGIDKFNKPHNVWFEADDARIDNCHRFTKQAGGRHMGCFVIPGTVNKAGQAGSNDIIEMQALLIDIDEGDTEEKLNILTDTLGQPTLIVESGGITKEGKAKLHVYWQLWHVVSGDDLKKLLELRHKIALSVGGDTHFKSAHQPIRVAGSVYHKDGICKLVKIRSYEPIEYYLEELINACSGLPDRAASHAQSNNSSSIPIAQIITSKVYTGGNAEFSRFNNLQRIIGFWLRRYHEGKISREYAWQEIIDYNNANVVPAWSEVHLRQMAGGLWRKHVNENGTLEESEEKTRISISSYSLDEYLQDNSNLPEDIIAPRILTPGGLFVFGGAPKVGKSDFLLNLFAHMAAGKEFLGFKPPRPLKIFYFQAEIGYHYLRERLQNMQLSRELLNIAKHNLQITPNSRLILNELTTKKLAEHIHEKFPDGVDIIAVDPIRNVFDGGRDGATENENDAMLFFLQQRIEALRDAVNPDAGVILVHHTKKLTQKQFDEEPFAAFSGASSLRSYYSTGAILRRSDLNEQKLELIFELRNGAAIDQKLLAKDNIHGFIAYSLSQLCIKRNQFVVKLGCIFIDSSK